MNPPLPGKRAFFKYASPDTTLALLQSRTVRYSSPLNFNDPFDVQSGLHFSFEVEQLPTKIIDRLELLASSTEVSQIDPNDIWGKIVLEVRQQFASHGFPRDRWEQCSSAVLQSLTVELKRMQEKFQNHWWNVLLPSVRVFCVSEERDNLLMWAHYAKDHTGAVFEFWSLPDEDNPLSVARPVRYVREPDSLFSESEFLDDIFSTKRLDVNELCQRYVYAKCADWGYEREWRVWYTATTPGLHDDIPIRRSEFAALYLGCRIQPDIKSTLLRLLQEGFPDVRVFQAERLRHAYALTYTEV